MGGGIRNKETAQELFDIGVKKIIIGSMLVKDPIFLKDLILKHGAGKIIAGIDVKNNLAAISGWEEATKLSAEEMVEKAIKLGAREFVITDISKDGALIGPNVGLYKKIKKKFPQIRLIASGGVSSIDDFEKLKEACVDGVILGKAIYEGKINLSQLT